MTAKVPLPLVVPVALAAAAGAAAAGDGGVEAAIAAGASDGATAQQVHALVDLHYLYPRCYIHLFHIAFFLWIYSWSTVFLFSKEPRIATPHSHPGCENQGNIIPKFLRHNIT